MPPELWQPGPGESPAQAQRICRSCPVQAACLQVALDSREPAGVWGGLTETDRLLYARMLKRERQKGRK